MSQAWAVQVLSGIDPGDVRLNKHAVRLLDRLADRPTASIPHACNGWAETQAAYRFLAQGHISWEEAQQSRSAWCWHTKETRPVASLEASADLIDWYRGRWGIEIFFDVLKHGCQVEELQLSTIERLDQALALLMIVAWRIQRLMRLGRTCPDMGCATVFDREEQQAAYIMAHKQISEELPPLNTVIRLAATYGGF